MLLVQACKCSEEIWRSKGHGIPRNDLIRHRRPQDKLSATSSFTPERPGEASKNVSCSEVMLRILSVSLCQVPSADYSFTGFCLAARLAAKHRSGIG